MQGSLAGDGSRNEHPNWTKEPFFVKLATASPLDLLFRSVSRFVHRSLAVVSVWRRLKTETFCWRFGVQIAIPHCLLFCLFT